MANTNGRPINARTQAILKELEASLWALSVARYGRAATLDSTTLSSAFENGIDALQKLRTATMWPVRRAGSITRLSTEVGWS
jgi:hypothetical protein